MVNKKKILIHDYSGHPFQVQLSRALAQRGYRSLHVFASFFQTPKGRLVKGADDPDCFEIKGIGLEKPFAKHSFVKRLFQEREYGYLLRKVIAEYKPDIVISSNNPLDPQAIIQRYCLAEKIKFIYWLQDIYGIAIHKILGNKFGLPGSLVGKIYIKREQAMLRKSDNIVLITKDFKKPLIAAGIGEVKMSVIPNWAPIDEMPLKPKNNPWAQKHGLTDKFCFIYSGTLGMKHNPGLLLALARNFRTNPDVRMVCISEGPGADWLKRRAKDDKLDNILFLGFQSFEDMPSALGSGDALLAILDQDAGAYSVPSKVLTYLCAAKPILLAVPSENLAAKIVEENKAGYVAPPQNEAEWIRLARKLYSGKEQNGEMGENARLYARKFFDINTICDSFESIIARY